MFFYYPWYSKYRGWSIIRHANGKDEIALDFLDDARVAAGIARKFNLDPAWAK